MNSVRKILERRGFSEKEIKAISSLAYCESLITFFEDTILKIEEKEMEGYLLNKNMLLDSIKYLEEKIKSLNI